jgi:hypothetical protein
LFWPARVTVRSSVKMTASARGRHIDDLGVVPTAVEQLRALALQPAVVVDQLAQ